jgi:ribosomal 50S subunit-associated protein YjgA (DUF615 family)
MSVIANQPAAADTEQELLEALEEHGRRAATLLRDLENLRRAALDAGVMTGTGLLAELTERLRAGEGQLEQLIRQMQIS